MIRTSQINKDPLKRELKRLGYLLFLLPVTLPLIAWMLWHFVSSASWAPEIFTVATPYAYLPLLVLYGLVPLTDALIGKDPNNPDDSKAFALSEQRYYRVLVYLALPLAGMSLLGGMALISNWTDLGVLGKFGLVVSFGTIHAGIMINAGHELIHKPTRHEQRIGGILLAMVLYPSFKIEHVRGHHINVATPLDHSTSRVGQSLYNFLAKALYYNVRTAWRLEANLLQKRNKPVFSWHNELLRWYSLVLLFALISFALFGLAGLGFFVAQGLVAIGVLETVNYLEHYGLRRRKNSDGRYERTNHHHSWNSNYLLSNLITFQLQRHSDHHANPQRRYQVLRHFDDSPQLPAGYSAMIVLALIPPLWMRVMNPRVQHYYADRE